MAKRRHAEVAAQVDRHYRERRWLPRPLTNKDIQWISGILYAAFAKGGEDNPGSAATWANVIEVNQEALHGPYPGLGIYETPEASVQADRKAALDRRFGPLVDAVLKGQGVVTDEGSRLRLLEAAAHALTQAAQKLHRNAKGDYRPDPDADRFPTAPSEDLRPPKDVASKSEAATSLWSVFERWRQETRPAASTLTTFRGHLKRAEKFFGHSDMSRITLTDVVDWKNSLVAEGLKNVGSGHLATLKSMYSYALSNGMVTQNPTVGVTVRQKPRTEAPRRAYTTAEVHRLLELARGEHRPFIRWLVWLTALSGARVSEPAQLWADCIRHDGNGWLMDLRPCPQGGSFKNRRPRTVPLHSALVETGFLSFVESRKGGPLFYKSRKEWDAERRHPSKSIANKVAAWIREQGITDPRVGPTHSFRHWFKTEAQRVGNDITLIDAVTGHAPRTVGDTYLHPEPQTLRRVVESIKIPPNLIAG